ncbi:hypothetical protein MTO96_002454 [Rhipicephalus appendiculatus]
MSASCTSWRHWSIKLDLPHAHQVALLNGDLSSQDGIRACTAAARALEEACSAQTRPGLSKMAAVQEQTKLLEKLRDKFSTTLSHHLNKLFLRLASETSQCGEVTLVKHTGLPQRAASIQRADAVALAGTGPDTVRTAPEELHQHDEQAVRAGAAHLL